MAGTSLITLLDDIASLLDDVALLTKAATRKTAGVLGDDLAVNAEQVSGVQPDRELPVIWAVFKGSALNKLILVPGALALSALAPGLIVPLLMAGGAYLCFEGFEKIAHSRLLARGADPVEHAALIEAVADQEVDLVAFERDKIRGAIRTDIVLSAEIVVISLGIVAEAPFGTRAAVLALIAALMTVGVYGFVAGIVKLDDLGVALTRRESQAARRLGTVLLEAAPRLMKGLSVAGTAAMFLVGGGIIVHGIPPLHHLAQAAAGPVRIALGAGVGLLCGGAAFGASRLFKRVALARAT